MSGRVRGTAVQSGQIGQVNVYSAGSPGPPGSPGSAGSPGSPGAGPPRQLPPATSLFTGRDADIAWFDEQWQRSQTEGTGALLLVSGTAGVGKSTLALTWLHRHAAQFPDGQLYADLSGYADRAPESPADVLSGFLRAMAVSPQRIPGGFAERVALFRTITHGLRLCVLLDNALSAAQVRVLAARAPGCATVVSTRGVISGLMMDGVRVRRVEPWDGETGVRYIEAALSDRRSSQEPDAVRRVVALCGGLPLALSVAAAKLAFRPRWQISRLVASLESDYSRLDILAADEETAVTPALNGSYRVLDEEAARLYRALGRCPLLDFDALMISAVLDCSAADAERQLEILVDANLLEELDSRYRFHDLVRLHAAHCADRTAPGGDEDSALGRLLDYLLAGATAAETLLTPSHRILERRFLLGEPAFAAFGREGDALAWLDRERGNLMAVLRYCAARGTEGIIWQLADAMWPLFLRLHYVGDRLEALRLAVRAAAAEGEAAAEASLLITLAAAQRVRGQAQEAADCCRRSLELYQGLGNLRGQGQACHGLGKLHAYLGEWDEAEPWFLRTLKLWEEADYRRGVALACQGLGRVAAARGQFDAADEFLRRSHEGLEREGDSYDAAWSLILHARVLRTHGDLDLALVLFDEAVERMSAAGSLYGQATALESSGQVHEQLGAAAEARERYTRSAALFTQCEPAEAERVAARLAGRLGPDVDQDAPIPPG